MVEEKNIVLGNGNDYGLVMIKTIAALEIHKLSIGSNVHYFGYSLSNDIQDNHYRSEVIEWLKTRKELDKDLDCFFCRPLSQLVKEVGNIDLVLYPKSNRSELVPLIIEALWRTMPNGVRYAPIEVVKNITHNIRRGADDVKAQYNKDNDYIAKEIEDGNLLIVDDINTSESTINELIKVAKGINPYCNIYIYTLMLNDAPILAGGSTER